VLGIVGGALQRGKRCQIALMGPGDKRLLRVVLLMGAVYKKPAQLDQVVLQRVQLFS
jgi:hypothetical protein